MIGEVKNTSQNPLKYVQIAATFYDSSGQVVAADIGYAQIETLRPGEKSPFTIFVTDPNQIGKITSYKLVASATQAEAKPANLKLAVGDHFIDSLGFYNLVGEVTNQGSDKTDFAHIAAAFYNSNGKIVAIGMAYTQSTSINPGDTSSFKMYITNNVSEIASASINVDSTQYSVINDQLSASAPSTPAPAPVSSGLATTGELTVEPQRVGPATQIKVTLIDSDQNSNPSTKQIVTGRVTITSDRGASSRADLNVDETGPNADTFTGKVRLNPAQLAGAANSPSNDVTINVLPGDLVSVKYKDERSADCQMNTVYKTVQVVAVDPLIAFDQQHYDVGDIVKITLKDLDANVDPDAEDIKRLRVYSTTDVIGLVDIPAYETGLNTGEFVTTLQLSTVFGADKLQVRDGDNATVEYIDQFSGNFKQNLETYGTLAASAQKFHINTIVGVAATAPSQLKSGIETTTISSLELKDANTDKGKTVHTNSPVILSADVSNNNAKTQPFILITEVRNEEEFTVSLELQRATLDPNGQAKIEVSWTPQEGGTFYVQAFVVSSLDSPEVLSEVVTKSLDVSE